MNEQWDIDAALSVVVVINGLTVETFGPFQTGEDAALYAETRRPMDKHVHVVAIQAPEVN